MLEPDKCRSNGRKWSCGKPEVSFRAGGQPGSYPETGLEEFNYDLLEYDFWTTSPEYAWKRENVNFRFVRHPATIRGRLGLYWAVSAES